jgi:hypothetical protein
MGAATPDAAVAPAFDPGFGDEDFGDESLYDPVGGKPFHGWSCECPEECLPLLNVGLPRPGEVERR